MDEKVFTSEAFGGVGAVVFATIPGCPPEILGEIQTVTYSIHRPAFLVRRLGRSDAVGRTKGARTVAGSLVFNVIDTGALHRILKNVYGYNNVIVNADLLPPIDLTITNIDELSESGHSTDISQHTRGEMSILGVNFIDESQTLSVEDIYMEQVFSYIAYEIVPYHIIKADELPNMKVFTTETQAIKDLLNKNKEQIPSQSEDPGINNTTYDFRLDLSAGNNTTTRDPSYPQLDIHLDFSAIDDLPSGTSDLDENTESIFSEGVLF